MLEAVSRCLLGVLERLKSLSVLRGPYIDLLKTRIISRFVYDFVCLHEGMHLDLLICDSLDFEGCFWTPWHSSLLPEHLQ